MKLNTIKLLTLVYFLFFLWSCGSENEENNTETQEDTISENTEDKVTSKEIPTENPNIIKNVQYLDDLLQYDSEAELIEALGKENVTRGLEYAPEGLGEYPVTKISEGTPAEITITWKDEENFTELSSIYMRGDTENGWKTKSGLYLGMPVSEIVALNGTDITFSGFAWDYAGFVNFQEGNLADESNTFIRLDLPMEAYDEGEKYNELLGDVPLSSDMQLVQEAEPIIVELGVGNL